MPIYYFIYGDKPETTYICSSMHNLFIQLLFEAGHHIPHHGETLRDYMIRCYRYNYPNWKDMDTDIDELTNDRYGIFRCDSKRRWYDGLPEKNVITRISFDDYYFKVDPLNDGNIDVTLKLNNKGIYLRAYYISDGKLRL